MTRRKLSLKPEIIRMESYVGETLKNKLNVLNNLLEKTQHDKKKNGRYKRKKITR